MYFNISSIIELSEGEMFYININEKPKLQIIPIYIYSSKIWKDFEFYVCICKNIKYM